MKLEIKKSEVAVLKQALRSHSFTLYQNVWVDADREVWEDTKSISCRISLLKKLSRMEKRLVDRLIKIGWQKRKQYQCWWMWAILKEKNDRED